MKTEWASFIKLGIQNKRDIMGEEVVVSGHRYFVFTKRLSPTWNVVALADSATALKKVRAEMASKRMYQILGLLIINQTKHLISVIFPHFFC